MKFDFRNPTRILFGEDQEKEVGKLLQDYGTKRVLLLYGGGSIKRSGLYDIVVRSLTESQIEFVALGGVRPNPTASFVREALKLVKEKKIDFLLAVGGGSVIDTAKSIGVGAYYEGDPFDFNLKKAVPEKTMPVGVILTIASAGSESSNSCVIQDDEMGIKQGFNSDLIRPVFAIENPKWALTVPSYQVFAGASDTMMHSLERYFNPSEENQIADSWALDLIRSTMEAVKKLKENPKDLSAMGTLMLNSSLSHDGLTSIGKSSIFSVHPLEHALSGYRSSITHGAGVALLYPAWAKYVYHQDLGKFVRLAKKVFGLLGANDEETAIMGIRAMKDFFSSIGMPASFGEVGLTLSDVPALVSLATGNGTRVVGRYPQPLEEKDVKTIYESLCKEGGISL